MLTHQGRVVDSSGDAVNASIDLRVSLYDAQQADSAFWTRLFANQPLQNGYYSVALVVDDDGQALSVRDFEPQSAWVGVSVNGVEYGQRQPLNTMPYAMMSSGVRLPDRPVGTCDTAGSLYWDSTKNQLHI